MATITLKGSPIETIGDLPSIGSNIPHSRLTKNDLSDTTLSDYTGKKVILNIFPSVDTPTCATSVRQFNEKAASIDNVHVLCVSADLPFAISRFCGAEGISHVESLSSFRSDFGKDLGLTITTGPLAGLLSRAVVIINEEGKVIYNEQVAEIADEPNYAAAISALNG